MSTPPLLRANTPEVSDAHLLVAALAGDQKSAMVLPTGRTIALFCVACSLLRIHRDAVTR